MRTWILAAILLGARVEGTAAPQEKTLPESIEALVRGAKLKDAKVGVLVHSAGAGRAVYALNEREPFLLASNTKLLTTTAALCKLGRDFKFRTSLGTVGADLHVFASGDPNIGGRLHDGDPAAVFKQWGERLRAAGVSRVENVVLHTGIFDEARMQPGWRAYPDIWFWWCAPFGPLSLNDNCVDLKVEPGAEGEPCKVTLAPDTKYVTVVNLTKSAARPARPFGFTRAAGTNTVTLRGDVGGRGSYGVTVHDPTMYFGTVLRETLVRAGVEVAGRLEESPRPREEFPDFKELAFWESGLAPTIAVCNQPSQNYYAEMLLRTLGWKLKGRGTTENGLAAVREFLTKDVGLEQVSQADGSGLTRENLASPSDLVKLLLYMRKHPHAKEFYDSLPFNGMPKGTLRNRMTADDVRGRVHAKTGHIGGVASLSGYAESLSGDTYVFSILVNLPEAGSTVPADRLQDRIAELLVRYKGD